MIIQKYHKRLFGPPKEAITDTDFAIGLNTSCLITDGGALQLGIGSIGDAVVYGLDIRQSDNSNYQNILEKLEIAEKFSSIIKKIGGVETFKEGLFGASEMFVDGFLRLRELGILKKKSLRRHINPKTPKRRAYH